MAVDKMFYRTTFKTVFPLMIQSLLLSSVNFIDQVMVGKLGIIEIAAVGVANKIYSLFYLVLYGTCSACVIFISQYWGKKDVEGLRKTMGMTVTITLSLGILVTMTTVLFPKQCMMMFSQEIEVVAIGAAYLRMVSLSYLLLSLIYPINYLLRGTQRVLIVIVSTSVSIAINIIANYAFIFGKFGMPRLGAEGAALGTVLTRGTELGILVIYLIVTKNEVFVAIPKMFTYSIESMKIFLKKALPLSGNEFLWGIGTTLYFIIYGRLGTEELAAMSIMNTLQILVQTFTLSFSGASAVIIGSEIGKGNLVKVNDYCKKFHVLGIAVGIVLSILMLILIKPIINIYGVQGTLTGTYLFQCLLVLSSFLIINCYNAMNVEGIFRSGGDIKFVMIMDMGGIWLVGLPLTFIAGEVLHLNVVFVYAMFIVVELYKLPIGIWRYKSGKWLHRLEIE